jgi:uncharacterized coiled-coil DUF342 family protein
LQKIYHKIDLAEDVQTHQNAINNFLEYAVKVRERENNISGMFYRLEVIRAYTQVEKAVTNTQKRISDLLYNED